MEIFTIKGKNAITDGQSSIERNFIAGKCLTNIFKNPVVLDDAGKEESLVLQAEPLESANNCIIDLSPPLLFYFQFQQTLPNILSN